MKKWIAVVFCVQLFTGVNGQRPEYHLPGAVTVSGSKLSMLPVLFNHHASAGLQGNGRIEEQLNNKPLFVGSVKNGRLHGYWQSWYQNGSPCDSGQLHKGLPDGVWKHWDEEGRLIALRTFSAEKYQRISHEILRYHPKRASYPLVKMYSKNRNAAMHFLRAGASFGLPDEASTLTLKEQVANNITGGNNYKPVFNRSLHHGLFMNFYPGGAVKDSGYYQNGLRHGIWKRVHENGNTETGAYQHGVKTKEWKIFDPSGKILELIVYTPSGKIRKTRSFN